MLTFKHLVKDNFDAKVLLEKYWPKVKNRKTMCDQRTTMEEAPYTVCQWLSLALKQRTWRPGALLEFQRKENGKLRNIQWRPNIPDSIVQQMLHSILEPIYKPRLILDTYSGLKGRGPSLALKRVAHMFRSLSRKTDEKYYIYVLDIHHYYPSIKPKVLKRILRRRIADKEILFLLDLVLDSYSDGLPFGDILSPLFANIYLSELDMMAKQKYGFKCYARYCDNIVVASESKEKLEAFKKEAHAYLENDLGLQVNPDEQIFPNTRGAVEFVGTTFNGHGMRLRKSTERRFRRAARRFLKSNSLRDYKSLASYWGMMVRKPGGGKLWRTLLGKPLRELYLGITDWRNVNAKKSRIHVTHRTMPPIESEAMQAIHYDNIPKVFADNFPGMYEHAWLEYWHVHRDELRKELSERCITPRHKPVRDDWGCWYYPGTPIHR